MRSWQDERLAEAAKPSMTDESLWGVHQQLKDELLHEIERTTGSKMSGDTLLIGFARVGPLRTSVQRWSKRS